MKRTQQTIRNLLLALVLLFLWWMFRGFAPFTKAQTLRWEARQAELPQPPVILAQEGSMALFTSGEWVGTAYLLDFPNSSYSGITALQQREALNFLPLHPVSSFRFYLITEQLQEGAATLALSMEGSVEVTSGDPLEAKIVDVAERYTVTAPLQEGIAYLYLGYGNHAKDAPMGSDAFWTMAAEDDALRDFIRRLQEKDPRQEMTYTYTITLTDPNGKVITTETNTFTGKGGTL